MKKWIYVAAYVDQPILGLDYISPGDISFEHQVVEADNEVDAYTAGQRLVGFQQELATAANDYVIPFPEAA